jgi:hypothetical protein
MCSDAMIRIAISAEAYEAVARTLPLGNVGYEAERSDGKVFIWRERRRVDRLNAMRGQGESYSDLIVRLARAETTTRPQRKAGDGQP